MEWHLTFRVPLNFAAIPEKEIARVCERFNLHIESWGRQERAFGLMHKVYAKRASIRGQQPAAIPSFPATEEESQSGDAFGSIFGY